MATLNTLNISDIATTSKSIVASVALTNAEIIRTTVKPTKDPKGVIVHVYEVSASTGTSTLSNSRSGAAPITSNISTVSLTIYIPVEASDLTDVSNVETNMTYATGTIIGTWSTEDLATIGIE